MRSARLIFVADQQSGARLTVSKLGLLRKAAATSLPGQSTRPTSPMPRSSPSSSPGFPTRTSILRRWTSASSRRRWAPRRTFRRWVRRPISWS